MRPPSSPTTHLYAFASHHPISFLQLTACTWCLRWADFRTPTRLTNAEAYFIAKHYAAVSLEKCTLASDGNTTEQGQLATARQLKQANPDLKVLAYWGVDMQGFQCSAAAQELLRMHPDYFLSNPTDGSPVMEKTYPQLDYRKQESRDWWVAEPLSVGGADSAHLIDGVLADGAGPRQIGSPTFVNFSAVEREKLANGSLAVLRMLQRKFDNVNGGLVLCNGINMYPNRYNPGTPMLPDNNFEIVQECDGVETEHLAAFESRDHNTGKLNITRVRKNLQLIDRAAALNKSVMVNLWAGPVVAPNRWPGNTTPNTTEEWRAALENHFNFSAALFLTVAAPTVFFEYVEWYPASSGVVPCPSCIAPTQWYPQVYQAVGPPRGPRVDSRGGTVLQRSFANVDVTVDLVTEMATLTWHTSDTSAGSSVISVVDDGGVSSNSSSSNDSDIESESDNDSDSNSGIDSFEADIYVKRGTVGGTREHTSNY